MAMAKTLWSISALSVEFGMDRRTVARKIEHIKSASKNGEPKQWFLADVVGALTNQPPAEQQHRGDFSDLIIDRLEATHERPQREMTLPEFALLIGEDEQTILARLRAGMPFRTEGDWSTGEGFLITPAHAIDWGLLVAGEISDRADLARELGL